MEVLKLGGGGGLARGKVDCWWRRPLASRREDAGGGRSGRVEVVPFQLKALKCLGCQNDLGFGTLLLQRYLVEGLCWHGGNGARHIHGARPSAGTRERGRSSVSMSVKHIQLCLITKLMWLI